MTPINRAQGLFVLREILSAGTDHQQVTALTIWCLALKHVKGRRRSIEVDPLRLAEDAGISWNAALGAVKRLTDIGAFLCTHDYRYAINPYVGRDSDRPGGAELRPTRPDPLSHINPL